MARRARARARAIVGAGAGDPVIAVIGGRLSSRWHYISYGACSYGVHSYGVYSYGLYGNGCHCGGIAPLAHASYQDMLLFFLP